MKEPCDSNTKIKGEAAAPPKDQLILYCNVKTTNRGTKIRNLSWPEKKMDILSRIFRNFA